MAKTNDGGTYTVTTVEQLNQWSGLAANATSGSNTLVVNDITQLDSVAFGQISPGDLLMVVQMQGATLRPDDDAGFGEVTALNSAGLYELIEVASVNRAANSIQVGNGADCTVLKNSYTAVAGAQVVRVPQFSGLTVSNTGTVTAMPWDGTRGGVVALHVRDTLTLSGTIDVSGLGFRGGAVDNSSVATASTDVPIYRSSSGTNGADKGEGIGGFQGGYTAFGGRYGRGAPANGGGGANAYRAGGGGGANASNGKTWNGQGVMDSTVNGAGAWQLDPGRLLPTTTANLADNSGGGRGGYSFSQVNLNATATAPGNAAWNGNLRRERGGLGGRPLDPSALSRLYLGGGGGAGDGDQNASGGGGRGGGMIYLMADTVSGAGALVANGLAGESTIGNHRDGAGGGGAGGTVIARANSLTGFSISANGGNGGRQLIGSGFDEATGPGGGGSGGYIATSIGNVTRSASGGSGGDTTSNGLTEFPTNGATRGATGVANATIAAVAGTAVQDVPICLEPANLSVTLTDGATNAIPGNQIQYFLTVKNVGPNPATRARVVDTFPATLGSIMWICSGTGGGTCAASGGPTLDQFVNLPVNATVTFTITATISSTATVSLTNQAVVYSPTVINDTDLTNNVAIDTDSLTPSADLTVTIVAAPTPVDEHAIVTWTVTVANIVPFSSQATNVSVNFTMPGNVTFISATGIGAGWNACTRVASVVTCSRNTLAAGASASFNVIATVNLPAGPLMTATADLISSSADPNGLNNSTSLSTTVNPINDPPVNLVPAAQTTLEDTNLVFSTGTGNAISTSDIDVGSNELTVLLVGTTGVLTLGSTANLTISVGDGSADPSIQFNGTLTAVNNALNGLTFTPTPNAFGSGSVELIVSDNGFTGNGGTKLDDDKIDITITPVNDPPTLGNDTFFVQEDSTTVLNVLANDSSAPDGVEVLTIISTTPASHGVVSGGGANLSYKPNANYFGPDTFTYTVSDGNGATAVATVNITVNPVNDPPTAIDDAYSVVEGSTNNPFPVLNNDTYLPDAPELLLVSVVGGPSHGSASISADKTKVLYSPATAFNGPDTFTYTITDPGGLTATATITVTVGPSNDPPINGVPSAQSIDEDTSFTFAAASSTALTVSDPDAANAPVQVTVSATNGVVSLGGVKNLTFSLGDGTSDATMSFTGTLPDINQALEGTVFTPTANFNGTATVEITSNDLGNTGIGGAKSDDDTVTITVNPINDPPTVVDDTATMAEDAVDQRIDVLANDSFAPDVGESLRVTVVSVPAHGTARLDTGGAAVRYTPAANFNGTDTFTYTITDGNQGTATGTVTVTVLSVNDPPQAVPDVFSVAQDSTDNPLDVLANDTIAPDVNETLEVIVVSSAQHGTVTIDPTGTLLLYTPTKTYIGPETLTYTVRDSNGGFAATIVSITVGADSDRDGLSDADELALGTNPLDPDSDHDHLSDGIEVRVGKTDPLDDDSDDDGLLDGNEDVNHNGVIEATDSNPLDPDTDKDGLYDGVERGLSAPQGQNTKLTVFRADQDPATQTNPLRPDTDNGGITDGDEDANHNGRIDADETNPNDPRDDRLDTDHDGLSDIKELTAGLDPKDADSDDDGVLDGAESLEDTDGDGNINALDPDSDNDGLLDGTESGIFDQLKPADTDVSKGHFVPDQDPASVTDPTKKDSDGDGLEDGKEDTDHNGKKDVGETDAAKADTDSDGLDDRLEQQGANPTNPELADTDGDGLNDGDEDANHNGKVDSGETDPNIFDSDHGGAGDGDELKRGTNPLNRDDDFDVRGGGGCSSTSGLFVVASALLMLALRRRRGVAGLLLLLVLSWAPRTSAQNVYNTAVDVQRFKPGIGSQDFLAVESANVAEHLRIFGDVHVGYADNPLILGIPGSNNTAYRLVDDLTFFDLSGGIALKDRAEVAIALPMSVAKGQRNATLDPSIGENPLGFAVGDLRLAGKYAFFPKGSALQLAASLRVGFPTGNTATLRGSGAFQFEPRILGELNLSVFRVIANAGFTLRTAEVRLLNLTVGQEFIWALGAEVPLYGDANRLSLLLTATGSVGFSQLSAVTTPVDALGGLRYTIGDVIGLELALGGGLTRGWATPRFEAVLGVSVLAKPIKLPETLVKVDPNATETQPVTKAETFAMGTPPKKTTTSPVTEPNPFGTAARFDEKDSDSDGVPDATDKCPTEKETINGITDDDGCPDVGEGLVSVNGSTLKFKARINFVRNGSRLTPGTEELLKQLAQTMRARRALRLKIEVYVTEMKTRDENDALSGARSQALRDYLESHGVEGSQLEVRSMGMQRPFDPSTIEVSPL